MGRTDVRMGFWIDRLVGFVMAKVVLVRQLWRFDISMYEDE